MEDTVPPTPREESSRASGVVVPAAPATGRLSDAERLRAASIVAMGCDPSTAGKYFGLSPAEWERVVADDPQLAVALGQAEAKAEIHHMKCVHAAAQEAKNYRASIWWLERMRPDVYHHRDADVLTHDFLEQIAEIIGTEVHDDATRSQIVARLRAIARV